MPLTRLFLLSALLALPAMARDASFKDTVQPFIANHCMDCHDADSARAGFRIDLLGTDFNQGNAADQWKEVMDNINSGKMPPKKKPRPDAKEAFAVASWVAANLRQTELAAQGAGGRVPMRRMNRVEYANTVRDLFSLEEKFARRIEKELPADGKVGGFDRGAAGLFMDEGQLEKYMTVADMVLDEAVFGEKPNVQKFTWDARKEKHIHGIGVLWKDDMGVVHDDNPTPEFVASLKDPLSKINVEELEDRNSKTVRYVPHGPTQFTVKGEGIEYLSGGSNYLRPGNLRAPFFAEQWAKKGVQQDGWYRVRLQAAAFKGEGQEAQKEVRLVLQYCLGSPIEVVQSAVIDAPLGSPKQYEFLLYLQAGPPGMNRNWRLGWDNGDKDVVIRNPLFQDIQFKPSALAGKAERALNEKKLAEAAALQQQSEEARAVALENRKTFEGPFNVMDPKLDIAKRPRLWLGIMEWEGPLVEWPPQGRKTLLFAGEDREDDAYLREIFARFLPRAYRRPATKEELDSVVTWTLQTKATRSLSLVRAVREGVKNVLCSPAFLYLGSEGNVAPSSPKAKPGPQPLDGWQLASRLSYLLWSSAPDTELSELARQNKLRDPAVLRTQVQRMVADPKAWEFVRNFAGQWLSVRNFENGNPPNRDFYRFYDDALRDSSRREPLEFFSEVLKKNLSVMNFIDSDFLVVDGRLAEHYGLSGVEGEAFRRVSAPSDGRRGGVLGMAGILTYLADGTRTLPVRRATWVLDTLWNRPVPPPPPNAGDLPPIKEKNLSVRARLEQHRLSDNCASCHSRVDSFGLALENYDATGMWRDRQNGEGMRGGKRDPELDVSGQLPDGAQFHTVQEFKTALLAQKETFVRGFTEKLLCYALGRPLSYGDHLTVDQITTHASQTGYGLQEILQATVASQFFQTQ